MTMQTGSMAKVAVIGAGYWGKNLVRNFHELNALAAICDSDEKQLQAFQTQYPGVGTAVKLIQMQLGCGPFQRFSV